MRVRRRRTGPTAFAGKHTVKPLPFDPAKLEGFSERFLHSNHENNYGGALKNLNWVEADLARVNKEAPAHVVGGPQGARAHLP